MRSIPQIYAEANKYWDAKDWPAARVRLEELYARKYRQCYTAMYLGEACFNEGDLAGAIQWDRAALAMKDAMPQAMEHLIAVKDVQPDTTDEEALDLRREWWNRFGLPWYRSRQPHENTRDPERVMRVGYVSGDFKYHSASTASATVTTGHTYEIEPFFYSTLEHNKYDELTHLWRKGYAETWRDASNWDIPRLLKQIRADQIDILVDLSGFTAGNRLLAFAARPAPIQIQAWGYVLGAGGSAIDVVFADPIVASAEIRKSLPERVVDLPTLLSYFPRTDLPEANPLPCLNKPPVFGVFNRAIKTNRETLTAWRQILDRVPGSMIRFQGFDYSDSIQATIIDALGAERVWFTVGKTDREHKLSYQGVDLMLDPWPQTGGVSTLDALYMGVPVITLIGPRMIQRTSASFLWTVGMPDFVSETQDGYIANAVSWVTARKDELAGIRAGLRGAFQRSGIVKGYVQAVEAAYRSLWREFCATGQISRYNDSASVSS